MENTHS